MTDRSGWPDAAPAPGGDESETTPAPGGRKRRRPSLRTAVSSVALAAALAALGVALTNGSSGEATVASTSAASTEQTTLPTSSTSESESDESATQPAPSSTAEEVYQETVDGVVEINATGVTSSQSPFGGPDGGESQALGTGFVIDDEGHIVTNEHVVEGASSVTVTFADGTELSAEVVGTDPSSDVALLEVDPSAVELHPLELRDSGDLTVGQDVYALGNPYGLDGTLTAGIISALDRRIQAPNGYSISGAIQTDAAINSGNSGGPLLDANGEVIGVTAQIESETGGNVGIGYAIPIDLVEDVVAQLESGETVEHAYLGVSIEELTSSLAESLGVEDGKGVYVGEVQAGSPAEAAGLQGGEDGQGDVIVAIDGQEVDSPEALTEIVSSKRPGDEVELEIVRDGETQTLTATLGTRPDTVQG